MAMKDWKRRVSIWAWIVRKGDLSVVPSRESDKMVMPARRTKLMDTRRVILLTISDCTGGVSSGYEYQRPIKRYLGLHLEGLSLHTQLRRQIQLHGEASFWNIYRRNRQPSSPNRHWIKNQA